MRTFGIIILIIGVILGIFALSMNTTVQVPGTYDRVNNIGLMNEKQNYLIVAGIFSLIGVIILIYKSSKTNKVQNHAFKITLEKAKIAEFKENYKIAVDMYLETLYHLENDYKNKKLDKSFDESRIKLIASLKIKVEKLKEKS